MSARVEDGRWQRRAMRARRLAGERAAMAETLYFYAGLAELQEDLLRRYSQPIARPSSVFADRLDPGAAVKALPELLNFIKREAPAALAGEVRFPADDDFDRWRHRIHTYWITGGREAWDADAIKRFALEALLQPFAETAMGPAPAVETVPEPAPAGAAVAKPAPGAAPSATCAADVHSGDPRGGNCDRCNGVAVVALLREQAHGAKRSLVCGFCLHEWPSPRLQCLQCGETTVGALPVFRSDEFDAVRIDACESCKTYVKTIDLTRDGEASPIVDDIASMPLDVWARDNGYRRLRPNMFGF